VIPYYNRFMLTLPDVKALNRAPLAKVLALWSGLGYYRRAENLKRAGRILAARHGAQLPADARELRALPGVGEYTAGAILSIAFGKPYPAVDGNIRRVLQRLLRISSEKQLRAAALKLVSKSRPGQLNQSLMELGSLLCTPKNPRCGECPVANLCPTARGGHRRKTAPSRKAVQTRNVTWPLAIVRRHGKLLLHRRAATGILAGLWEFPGGENTDPGSFQSLLEGQLPGIKNAGAMAAHRVGVISHAITNRRIHAPVFLIELASAARFGFDRRRWRWLTPAALDGYPTSSMTRKAVRLLKAYEKRRH
jgi:A/G-specific adenine glycosylase